MKVGDHVQYFEDRDSAPIAAVVSHVYPGTCWVSITLESGAVVSQVFAAQTRWQSPLGGMCIQTPTC